jgi:hypothetical protein
MAEFYEYQTINVSLEPLKKDHDGPGGRPTIADAANRWSKQGWRTVAVMPAQGPSYADTILIERKRKYLGIAFEDDEGKHVLHPDDVTFIYAENE